MNMVLVFSRMRRRRSHRASSGEQRHRTATLAFNRSQNQRLQALKKISKSARFECCATDIAARASTWTASRTSWTMISDAVEDYVHRIGRTGRAHAIGDAISFVTPEDHAEVAGVGAVYWPWHRAETRGRF